MRSMSSVRTPRFSSTSNSAAPKSSPTGPTGRTSVKKLAAREKCTAAPPSMRSRSPKGVLTASKAIDPTTVSAMRTAAYRLPCETPRPMKAIQIEGFGGPEVLRLVDLPDPAPGEGQVLVEVARSGVHFADTHATRNDYLAEQSLPLIPGAEICGRTPDGRRVAALVGSGGYAEKGLVPEALLIPVPDEVDDDQAAAMLL